VRVTRTDELRERLLGFRPTDRLWGWLGPGLIALVGGFLRLWRLGDPHQLVFDETYYVKQAYSMLEYGVEMRTQGTLEKPDALFTAGTTNIFNTTNGDLVVHPPLGKWVIAVGEWLFGIGSSVGWRFSVALLGTVSILVIGRVARRMFGSTLLGCVASFLLAFEGHAFVIQRTGILDSIVMFFALVSFAALLLDRDRSRGILADKVGALPPGVWPRVGPWVGLRPWRWVAGATLGMATATKWSGLFFIAAFAIMSLWWDMGARRAAGVRRWGVGSVLGDGPLAAVSLLLTAGVVYAVSWTGWFLSTYGYDRGWAAANPGKGVSWLPPAVRSLVQYHQEMWHFNTTLSTPHPYQSDPWGWLVQARPTSFFYEGPKHGQSGCTVASCSKAIHSVGTISVWWLGTAALVVVLWSWLVRRDWRSGAIAAGIIGGYLPWFLYQHRTIFEFYSIAFEPWVILAVVLVLGMAVGGPDASPARRRRGLYVVGGYLLLTLALFAFFYPIYTAEVIPYSQWHLRMWFPSWV
jgi:dolichyl-phosphate-mannose--protein O-mannosyl transferase